MLTAKEAREIAYQVPNVRIEKALEDLLTSVKMEAEKGKYQYVLECSELFLRNEEFKMIKLKLLALGYVISGKNKDGWIIEW